jgi:hypothetical protein
MVNKTLAGTLVKALLVLDLIAVNWVVGYLVYSSVTEIAAPVERTSFVVSSDREKGEVVYHDGCGSECKKYIDEKIAGVVITTSVFPTPTAKPVTAAKSTTTQKTRREEILTIPGSGSSLINNWTDLSGTEFYFDTRDYPGLVEVYFEANMRLHNGNGVAYVRLFDITNGIAVVGGENNTTSQSDVWVKSQKVYFWAGRNLIRVQAKSLTADTAVYNQGKLRIVTEN